MKSSFVPQNTHQSYIIRNRIRLRYIPASIYNVQILVCWLQALKPGAAMSPCAGVVPALLDGTTGLEIAHDAGQETSGLLVLTQPWPSMARTCWRNHQRFEETYFSFDGYYLTGDGARRS